VQKVFAVEERVFPEPYGLVEAHMMAFCDVAAEDAAAHGAELAGSEELLACEPAAKVGERVSYQAGDVAGDYGVVRVEPVIALEGLDGEGGVVAVAQAEGEYTPVGAG